MYICILFYCVVPYTHFTSCNLYSKEEEEEERKKKKVGLGRSGCFFKILYLSI